MVQFNSQFWFWMNFIFEYEKMLDKQLLKVLKLIRLYKYHENGKLVCNTRGVDDI